MFLEYSSKMLEDNFQMYRIALAHMSAEKKEDIEKLNKFRDLRVYNTLAGNPIIDLSSEWGNIRFGRKDVKEFKKTQDIEKVREIFPKLLQKAITEANGDPYKLRDELEKLKGNNYQTMPSPERYGPRFLKYITYLEESQGKEEAAKRLEDYIKQNTINKAKSSLVPSL